MKRARRGRMAVVAVVAAVACLMALSAPASAGHLVVKVHSGHITTNWDAATHDIPHPPPNVTPPICVPGPDATDMTITTNHVFPGQTMIGAGALVHADEIDAVLGGANTRVTLQTVGTAAGSVSSTGAITQTVHLHATVRNCAGTTVLCTFSLTVHLTGQSSGNDDTLNVGDTATLTGTSNGITTAIGCNNAVRSTVIGQTITITLNVTVIA